MVTITDNTIYINEDGIENRVRIDHVTRASRQAMCIMPMAEVAIGRLTIFLDVDLDDVFAEEPATLPTTDSMPQPHAVDRILGHQYIPNGIRYLVRCVGY